MRKQALDPVPPPSKKRVPKARREGQRAPLQLPPPSAPTTTQEQSEQQDDIVEHVEDTQYTNATERGEELGNSESPFSTPQPQPQLKPPPKVPPNGPNGRYLLKVMNGYVIDYSEAVSMKMHQIFKERSDPMGSSWKTMKPETKVFYYEEFKKYFEWDDSITPMMKIAWDRLTKARYGEYISRMRKKWKKEIWVTQDVWTKWCADWTTPEALKKFETARLNRRRGGNGPAKPTHTGGSVSARTTSDRLGKRLGHPPSLVDLFRHTHTQKGDGENFIDNRSKEINEKLESLREELGMDEQVDGSQLYLRAVGGPDKRQRIFGIGSLVSQVQIPILGSSSDNIQFQSTSVDASIQNQLNALKACVEQQKKSAEEDRKNMVDALRRERQERKELSERLEQALAVIATFPGKGTSSAPALP